MNFYTRRRRSPMINIISLIDILAILLIFFIVTTTFKKRKPRVEIALPHSATAAESQVAADPVMVTVAADSKVYLGEKEVGEKGLADAVRKLRASETQAEIGLEVHKEVPFQTVVGVLDALKEAGVENIPAFTEKRE